MRSYAPMIFSLIMIALIAVLYLLALRFLNRPWWSNRKVRWMALGLPVIGFLWVGGWWLAVVLESVWFRNLSVLFVGIALVFELSLLLTLPLSSLIRNIGNWLLNLFGTSKQTKGQPTKPFDPGRRRALGVLAAAVPVGTLAMGAGGFGRALAGINVAEMPMTLPGLPDQLRGLKIFHMSDLHLGPFVKLSDIEEALQEAEKQKPDIILVTGDIADEVSMLPDVLSMIDQLKPRLGSFASLGNHEHFRGVTEIRRIIDRSPVRLLVDEGTTINVGDTSIALSAIDDPRRMRGDLSQFFSASLDKALGGTRSDDFIILMSHRPSVFDQASEHGVNLTLSGHTHGGQVGWMGRSIFESYSEESYLWGEYAQGKSRMYTSAGMGHWFPFRLGCPPEAPIITLG